MEEITREACADFETELVEFNGENNHVHLLLNFPPKVTVSKLLNSPKTVHCDLQVTALLKPCPRARRGAPIGGVEGRDVRFGPMAQPVAAVRSDNQVGSFARARHHRAYRDQHSRAGPCRRGPSHPAHPQPAHPQPAISTPRTTWCAAVRT
jgi:hypothetical protein